MKNIVYLIGLLLVGCSENVAGYKFSYLENVSVKNSFFYRNCESSGTVAGVERKEGTFPWSASRNVYTVTGIKCHYSDGGYIMVTDNFDESELSSVKK